MNRKKLYYMISLISIMISCLLAGCGKVPVSAAASKTNTQAESVLPWQPCVIAGIDAKCGYLEVPEDRSNPDSRILKLKFVVVPAQITSKEPDPLFYITGGPGGIDTDPGVVSTARTTFWDLNVRRDIVYLDQRGTNDPHRLSCEDLPVVIRDATQPQVDDWMQQCLAGLDGDPRFYTTAEAMRDLDAARVALGYDKINLYGGSYGGTAVQVYMRMFPQHVRTAVLYHTTALNLPFFQALPDASQAALDQIFTYCEQDAKCHAAYPDIRGDWQAVINRLRKGPVATRYTPPGADQADIVELDEFVNAIHTLMFQSGTYAGIPSLVHALAVNEDWTAIVKQVVEQQIERQRHLPPPQPFLLMANMIFCFEPAWGNEPGAIARLNPGSYITENEVLLARDQQKICAALPKPDPSQIYPRGRRSRLSVLMINSLIDPQNPPSNIRPALKEFTKSRLVIEPAEGHCTMGSDCIWRIIYQYIEQGSVKDLDTSCLEKVGPAFITESN